MTATKNQKSRAKAVAGKSQHRTTAKRSVAIRANILKSKQSQIMSGQKTSGKGTIILVSASAKPESSMTSFEKMAMIKQGISKKDLEKFKKDAKLDYEQLAEGLAVTRATLINKKGKAKFSIALSEKIVSLADIYSYGYEVFEDKERFNEWMHEPNRALDGAVPYSIVDNQYGREEVKNLIGRIDYGVYS